MAGVQLLHPAADQVERPLEVPQVLHRRGDLLRLAVDELVRLLGLPELLLPDLRAEGGGGLVAPVLDGVRDVVRADLVQALAGLVGHIVDAFAEALLGLVDALTDLVDALVDTVTDLVGQPTPVHHQRLSPHRGCSAWSTVA
nr:hypothetical protein [Streptomyces lateritius]